MFVKKAIFRGRYGHLRRGYLDGNWWLIRGKFKVLFNFGERWWFTNSLDVPDHHWLHVASTQVRHWHGAWLVELCTVHGNPTIPRQPGPGWSHHHRRELWRHLPRISPFQIFLPAHNAHHRHISSEQWVTLSFRHSCKRGQQHSPQVRSFQWFSC